MNFVGLILFSLIQAVISTLVSLGVALPVAHFFYRYRFPGKLFFLACAALLCIMPTKLVVFSIAQTFGLGGFLGIVCAHLMLNVPFSVFVLSLAYHKLDATMLWVARDLGATEWQTYKHIIFPFLRSTLISMALLLFMLHLTSYSIPLLLGTAWYHHTPDIVISNLYTAGLTTEAWGLWLVRAAVCLPCIVLLGWYDRPVASPDHRVCAMRPEPYKPAEHGWWWLVYGAFVIALTLVPFVVLLVSSCTSPVFCFWGQVVRAEVDAVLKIPVYVAIVNSLVLALVSGFGSVLVAYGMNHMVRRVRGRWIQPAIVVATVVPLVIGAVGVGIFFAWCSAKSLVPVGVVGIACHIFLNYPFAYRIISSHMDCYHDDMKKTAQVFGASSTTALRTVVVPFARPALVTAFCVAFGLSMTEVGAGSVLQGQIGTTMPMAIHAYRAAGDNNALLGLSMILILLVLGMSVSLSRWTSR